jgi:hypothetical protein
MAAELGVSYNTARSRLDDIVLALGGASEGPDRAARGEILDRLAAGDIEFDEALRLLQE